MKRYWLVLSALILSACAAIDGGNARSFNGQMYDLLRAELGNPSTIYYYQNRQNPNLHLAVERDRLLPQDPNGKLFSRLWLQKEQQYRARDCRLTAKQAGDLTYYICAFQNRPAVSIYVFSTRAQTVWVKVWINRSSGSLSPDAERQIAQQLRDFTP